MSSEIGIKHDGNKVRYHLVPVDALNEVARVFTFGAKKYSSETSMSFGEAVRWVENRANYAMQNVIRIALFTAEGNADLATSVNSGKKIPVTRSDSEKTLGTGSLRTLKTYGNTLAGEEKTPKNGSETRLQSAPYASETSERLPANWLVFGTSNADDAQFATDHWLASGPSMWTIVIREEESGEFYAAGATTASGCLVKALNYLNAQFHTLRALPPVTFEETKSGVIRRESGERNWEKGISFSRLYRGALHHLIAWWSGEERDVESGLHPLAHAICGLMFILALALRKRKDMDDRPANTEVIRDTYSDEALGK